MIMRFTLTRATELLEFQINAKEKPQNDFLSIKGALSPRGLKSG
jgi:hypothetical protein